MGEQTKTCSVIYKKTGVYIEGLLSKDFVMANPLLYNLTKIQITNQIQRRNIVAMQMESLKPIHQPRLGKIFTYGLELILPMRVLDLFLATKKLVTTLAYLKIVVSLMSWYYVYHEYHIFPKRYCNSL